MILLLKLSIAVIFTVMFSSAAKGMGLENFKKEGIVPDVVDNAPSEVATVKWPSGVDAQFGNILTPTQVQKQPNITWNADPNKFYLVCMTDPDAPSRKEPTYREWHHYLIGNVPGNDIEKGEVLSQYVGSGPPSGTGHHRYVFLIYEQPGKVTFDWKKLTNRSGDGRGKFKIRDFVKKHNISKLVAGNFYLAEFDDYVPKLYEQLAGK